MLILILAGAVIGLIFGIMVGSQLLKLNNWPLAGRRYASFVLLFGLGYLCWGMLYSAALGVVTLYFLKLTLPLSALVVIGGGTGVLIYYSKLWARDEAAGKILNQ